MEEITGKLDKTIDKPIYAIRIIAIFMLLDFFAVKIQNNNFINLIFVEKDYMKIVSTITYVLVSIFILKVVIGTVVSKLYLRYGNNFVKIPDYGSFNVEFLLNKAAERKDNYTIDKLKKIQTEIITMKKNIIDVAFYFAIFVVYYFSNRNSGFLNFTNFFIKIGFFLTLLIMGIIIYVPFSKKDSYYVNFNLKNPEEENK